jgi:prepilin-type N-terminal cleavage/methylation domain-containing protein
MELPIRTRAWYYIKYMHRRAFTLIELLVVIAIIGLLSSIAVISTSTIRDKAKITSGMSFDATLGRTLGSGVVATYLFEEGAGGTTTDGSGSGNTGTFVSSPVWSSDVYGGDSKFSLSFAGGNYVSLSKGFGISNTNFTFALWIKTTSANGQMSVLNNSSTGDGYRFGLTGGFIYFLIGNGSSVEGNCSSTQKVNDGKWHHIAAVFDRTNLKVNCYIDGRLAGSVAILSPYYGMSDVSARIGTTYCCTTFVGQLDNVSVYAQNLSGVSVNNLYKKERPRFVLANLVNKIERIKLKI